MLAKNGILHAMHVVNQWRRYKVESTWLFARAANVFPASTAAKTSGKSMWIYAEMSKPVMGFVGSTKH